MSTDDPPLDPTFDFPAEAMQLAGENADADKDSPRMREYHRRMWSGRAAGLKGGKPLSLVVEGDGLRETSRGMPFCGSPGGLYLTSDRAIPTWWSKGSTAELREDAALTRRIMDANKVLEYFGGIMLFPGNKIDGHQTINGAKGFHPKIADRLDLTVECIRLGYAGIFDHGLNRLGPVIERYWQFFDLFDGFEGYVDFWLLNDMLGPDGKHLNFFLEGDLGDYDFGTRGPLPTSVEEYDRYLDNARSFTMRRNDRMIQAWR